MAKAYRQKGTGRARQGNKKAAHFRGGGVAHGPRPFSSGIKVNRKVRAAALKAALSRRQQEGSLFILEDFALPDIKTGRVATTLKRFEAKKALVVDTDNHTLAQSARNLADSRYLPVAGLNVYDVFYHDVLIFICVVVDVIHGRFQS
jgi:large subunit ribosomal protein L4